MREAFTTACEQLQEHCADAGAALATEVRIHWLRIEAYVTRDAEMVEHLATEIFEDSGLESLYNMWNMCAMALRAVPVDATTVTALYDKACKAVTDYPDQIKEDAKKFAREAGTPRSRRRRQNQRPANPAQSKQVKLQPLPRKT